MASRQPKSFSGRTFTSSSSKSPGPAGLVPGGRQSHEKEPSLLKLKENVLDMLRAHPEGVNIAQFLSTYKQHYGQPLVLGRYGLTGLQELLAALGDDVAVQRQGDKNVITISSTGHYLEGGLSAQDMAADRRKVVNLVKQHPEGIPVKKLAVCFSQAYKRNLTLSALGYSTMAGFLESFQELAVEKETVFHRAHRTNAPHATPQVPQTSQMPSAPAATPTPSPPAAASPQLPPALAQVQAQVPLLIAPSMALPSFGLAPFPVMAAAPMAGSNVRVPLYMRYAAAPVAVPMPLPTPQLAPGASAAAQPTAVNGAVESLSFFGGSRDQSPLAWGGARETPSPIRATSPLRATPSPLRATSPPLRATSPLPQPHTQPQHLNQPHYPSPLLQAQALAQPVTLEALEASMMNGLAAGDFPPLGAAKPTSKAEERRQKMAVAAAASSAGAASAAAAASGPAVKAATGKAAAKAATASTPAPGPAMKLAPSTAAASGVVGKAAATAPAAPATGKAATAAPAAPVTGKAATAAAIAAAMTAKEQERERERESAVVFHEGYHAQLREQHAANVRAAEALEVYEGGAGGSKARRGRNSNMTTEEIDNLAEDVIRSLASRGELVTVERVESQVCDILQVQSLQAVKIYTRLPAVIKLLRAIKEINMFIEAMNAVSAVCTLYELGQALAGLQNRKRFEELHLGPLCKIPLIHKMFKVDPNMADEDIHRIETVDILRSLQAFRKNVKGKVDLSEFMKHVADQYNCESPYELGIRIQGLGLPISTLTRAVNSMHTSMDTAKEKLRVELEQEVQDKMWKIKRAVMEPAEGAPHFSSSSSSSRELRRKYAGMSAADAVMEVFSHAEGAFSSHMAKRVQTFLAHVKDDRLAKNLFQLAICSGSLDVPNDLPASGDKAQKKTKDNNEEEEEGSIMAPSETAVTQYLQGCLTKLRGALTLAYLADLEKKMAEHFKVKGFSRLAQGNFLEFLFKHSESLQQAVGGSILIGSQVSGSCGFRPSQQDVFEFISQCGAQDPGRLPFIEACLCSHYGLRDARELGYGPLATLLTIVQRQRSLGDPLTPSLVRYEAPLLPQAAGAGSGGLCESVGLLGDVRREQAVCCLASAPLLEDLEQWSLWELVFRPSQGPLKEFIEKHCGRTDLMALEVRPGVLLRVTRATGDKHFAHAAQTLDAVGAAGHLVSIAVADGIANTPTALLANHMESSLAAAVAMEDSSQSEDGPSYSRVAQFILECITRIPMRICKALLQQIFLEPLSKVVGQAVSKAVLLERARAEPRYLNRLHQMGLLLGITEWARDYHSKLLTPPTPPDNNNAPAFLSSTSSPSLANTQPQQAVVTNGVADDGESEASSSDDDDKEEKHVELPDIFAGLDDTDYSESDYSASMDELDSGEEPVSDQPSDLSGEEEEEGEEDDDDDEEEEKEEASADPSAAQPGDTPAMDEEKKEKEEDDDEKADDAEEQPAVPQLSPQRAVVEDIRRSDFGVGVELNEEGQRLMQVHQERLGRSLQRLSTELYSKDTHFVLELIQNADDNSYPSGDGSQQPSLAFVIEKDCITILNNESGFQERNIRAICDVGRSTKGKHTIGYIGQKGIGFKSVFKVTDRPEIHSNDFHLRFDKTSGPMGYILPHWVQEDEDQRPLTTTDAPEIRSKSWTTKILLPLRTESLQTKNLFRDVHPSLLLFLHRLRSITIYNQTESRLVTMSRQDLSHNILEVRSTHGLERWLVVKSLLHPNKIKEEVESTELAMAFCLSDTSSSSSSSLGVPLQPRQQSVFAFLPLRSFGFRFIIQGDFDIPSSREDVDRDSSWNQWLRSNLPQLFMQAMDVFREHPDFSGLKGLCHFLQYVPLPDEIQDFFKPVASQILQLLRGRACLPAKPGPDGAVSYKQPSELAVCQDPVIQEVVSCSDLERHLRLAYLHPLLTAHLPAALLATLGVRRLRGADVAAVTCAMARQLVTDAAKPLSAAHLKTLARLLQCNYLAQEHEYGDAQASLQGLKDLPIIPLADGRLVTLSSGGVFFPIAEEGQQKGLEALYRDLCTVSPSLLSSLDALGNSQVRDLLRRLGVHELEPQQVLRQHIYPALSSEATWKMKSQDVVVSYLLFLKQHVREQDYGGLEVSVPVLTNRGLLCPAQSRVHFPKEYGNMDLPSKLPGVEWVLVDPCYLRADRDQVGWRELLQALGVRDLLIFKKERRTLNAEQLACSPWADESKLWPRPVGGVYILEDHQCEEFQALATAEGLSDKAKLEQRRNLLGLLNNNWDTGERYSQYLSAQLVDSDGRAVRDARSSFRIGLTRLPWVPAFRAQQGAEDPSSPSPSPSAAYHCPGAVYLYSHEVHSLLGAHVDYVDMSLAPSEFTRGIGMRHTVSVDEMIEYLKKWSSQASADPAAGGPGEGSREGDGEGGEALFTTTTQHIGNVYSYLQTNCPPRQLKELFQHTPAVFVEMAQRMKNNWCSGQFYHLRDVCWSDPTGMFLRYKDLVPRATNGLQEPKFLAPFYGASPDMKSLFLGLGVERNPSMRQYVELLEVVCESQSQATGAILQDVSVIYAKLAEKCKVNAGGELEGAIQLDTSYCSSLREMLSGKRVFPSKRSCWVSLSQRPMIPDDKHLEKIFQDQPQVCLLNLPPALKKAPVPTGRTKPGAPAAKHHHGRGEPCFSEEDRSVLLELICNVRRLSESVTMEAHTVSYRPSAALQAQVRDVMPYLQRYLCSHDDFAELYAELRDGGIAQQVKGLTFGQVGELYIHYRLEVPDGEELYEKENVICLLKDGKELYIQKDYLKSKLDICRELVKLFCHEGSREAEKLQSFLESLMGAITDPVSLKRFLDMKGVRELPSEEEPWEVPMPVELRPEPSVVRQVSSQEEESVPERKPHASGEEGGGLFCWPPQAGLSDGRSGGPVHPKTTDPAVEASLKMWPPPNAPSPSGDWTKTPANAPLAPTDRSPRPPGPPSSGEPLSPRSPLPEGHHPASPRSTLPSSHTQSAGGVGGSASLPGEALHQRPPSAPCAGGAGGGGNYASGGLGSGGAGSSSTMVGGGGGGDDDDQGRPREEAGINSGASSSSHAPHHHSSGGAHHPHPPHGQHGANQATQHGSGGGGVASTNPPEVISSQFQGVNHVQRSPLALDSAVWQQALGGEAALAELALDCPLPPTVVDIMDEDLDLSDVGLWGERLVHSFLTHWQAHGPAGPTQITWYNSDGETGQACDFKLTFVNEDDDGESDGSRGLDVVYVEVKTTTKQDRHLIRLSANELDFALKKKEQYHIYRVYGAGDAQNVRLCRIRNLAQHLHSKTLELFLFV